MSSNNSESNLSTSKYSFKTGTLKNIYTLKHHPLEGLTPKPILNLNHLITPLSTIPNTIKPNHKFSHPNTPH